MKEERDGQEKVGVWSEWRAVCRRIRRTGGMKTSLGWRCGYAVLACVGSWGEARGQVIAIVEPGAGFEYSSATYVAPGGTVVGISFDPGVFAPRPTRWASAGGP